MATSFLRAKGIQNPAALLDSFLVFIEHKVLLQQQPVEGKSSVLPQAPKKLGRVCGKRKIREETATSSNSCESSSVVVSAHAKDMAQAFKEALFHLQAKGELARKLTPGDLFSVRALGDAGDDEFSRVLLRVATGDFLYRGRRVASEGYLLNSIIDAYDCLQMEADEMPDESDPEDELDHEHWPATCNVCDRWINGGRWKKLGQDDYDLCEKDYRKLSVEDRKHFQRVPDTCNLEAELKCLDNPVTSAYEEAVMAQAHFLRSHSAVLQDQLKRMLNNKSTPDGVRLVSLYRALDIAIEALEDGYFEDDKPLERAFTSLVIELARAFGIVIARNSSSGELADEAKAPDFDFTRLVNCVYLEDFSCSPICDLVPHGRSGTAFYRRGTATVRALDLRARYFGRMRGWAGDAPAGHTTLASKDVTARDVPTCEMPHFPHASGGWITR